CTSLVIGKYPLKFGERRRETARIHFQNLASNSHFGNQPDRQGLKLPPISKKLSHACPACFRSRASAGS
ncbi:MAG: hypothetical protein WA012_13710, partial [Rhodoferax sp.]|uniref:hypothetical protein n=1 Tax=Rhodoferax sp. TaxID=50421 RepID=UPI003BB50AFB